MAWSRTSRPIWSDYGDWREINPPSRKREGFLTGVIHSDAPMKWSVHAASYSTPRQ